MNIVFKVSLELGGKNAAVVFDDADVDAAVAGVTRWVYHCIGWISLTLWISYRVSHPTLLSPATADISDKRTPNQVGLFEPGRDLPLHEQDFCAKRDLRNFFGGQHPKHHHYIFQDHLNKHVDLLQRSSPEDEGQRGSSCHRGPWARWYILRSRQ